MYIHIHTLNVPNKRCVHIEREKIDWKLYMESYTTSVRKRRHTNTYTPYYTVCVNECYTILYSMIVYDNVQVCVCVCQCVCVCVCQCVFRPCTSVTGIWVKQDRQTKQPLKCQHHCTLLISHIDLCTPSLALYTQTFHKGWLAS